MGLDLRKVIDFYVAACSVLLAVTGRAPGRAFSQGTRVSHSGIVRDAKTQRWMTTAVATAEPTTVRITVPQ